MLYHEYFSILKHRGQDRLIGLYCSVWRKNNFM